MSQAPKWPDKYKIDVHPNLRMYDFSQIKDIPVDEVAQAQAILISKAAERPTTLQTSLQYLYKRIENMPMIPLNSGYYIPAIGLGTWKAERGQVRSAVHVALQAGYRHIDCASVYQNEDEVGDVLEYVLSHKLIDRSELFICSKVWNSDHSSSRVRSACLKSLQSLKLDYLDLYLIHWPVTGNIGDEVKPSIKETWRALESLVKDGLVRSIGVSNFSAKKLEEIESYAEIKPSVCQVEVHPYWRNDKLIAWCKQRGIHVTAFSPLGSPDSESIFPRKVPAVLLKDPRIAEIARKQSKNVGQVLIRWALQHGTSVIPKSTSPDRIRGNLDVLDWKLDDKDYAIISSFKFQQRMVNGGIWLNPKGPYRTMEDLWDEEDLEPNVEDLQFPDQDSAIKSHVPLSTQTQQKEQYQKERQKRSALSEDTPSSSTAQEKQPLHTKGGGEIAGWTARMTRLLNNE